jgi:hypothetical protein
VAAPQRAGPVRCARGTGVPATRVLPPIIYPVVVWHKIPVRIGGLAYDYFETDVDLA